MILTIRSWRSVFGIWQRLLQPRMSPIWQFGSPCATFCDFQLLNHGTRSFSSPSGDGTRDRFADLSAELCKTLFANHSANSHSRVAHHPGDIPKSGICLACGGRGNTPGPELSQWTCALGILALRKAPQAIFIASEPGGWSRGSTPAPASFFRDRAQDSVPPTCTWVLKARPPQRGPARWRRSLCGLGRSSAPLTSTGTGAAPWPARMFSLRSMPFSRQPWRAYPPPPTRGGGCRWHTTKSGRSGPAACAEAHTASLPTQSQELGPQMEQRTLHDSTLKHAE